MDPKLADHPRYDEARRRVRKLRGFYGHLTAYILAMTGLLLLNLVASPGRWWVAWVAFGWGSGLLAHGLSVFAIGGFFGPDWEELKIREYLEKNGRR